MGLPPTNAGKRSYPPVVDATRRAADRRLVTLGLVFLLAWIGIGYRLVRVQGFEAESHAARGEDQRVRHEDLAAPRGTIYDRDSVELAVSIDATTISVNPSELIDPEELARRLSPIVGVPESALLERFMMPGSQFAYVARGLERNQASEVRNLVDSLETPGVYFDVEPKRIYPGGSLASQVIGFVRHIDMVGLEGLEWKYDDLLSGVPGQRIVERDPYGNPIPQGEYTINPAQPGSDIMTTLDREIEFVAQQTIEQAVTNSNALTGTVVVLDVANGEILAMVSFPNFDPNDHTALPPATYRNRAVTDVYEPGSTLKVVAVAAALEESVIAPDDAFDLPSTLKIGDKAYTDFGRRVASRLSVADIVAKSSNVGTILIQRVLGNEAHHRYLSAFGLGATVSSDLPGEVSGKLEDVAGWCDTTCGPSTAIGYRVDVTPLQMASVYATIANDGLRVEPHVVRETIAADGVKTRYQPTVHRVISEETARTMRGFLRGVVESGTGSRGVVDQYRVGGKTGTTEKFIPGEGYSEEDRIASFVGIAPIDEPRIAVAVVLDSPYGVDAKGYNLRIGGVSAAPVFAAVAEAALHRLGVPPSD